MLVRIKIRHATGKMLGEVVLRLLISSHRWLVHQDKDHLWHRIASNRDGLLESKSWGVAWLWDRNNKDKKRNPIILHKPPLGEVDTRNTSGTGFLFDPIDTELKDSRLLWAVQAEARERILTPVRKFILELCNSHVECSYGDDNYKLITANLKKDDQSVRSAEEWQTDGSGPIPMQPGLTGDALANAIKNGQVKKKRKYTTCGSLTGFLGARLGAPDKFGGTNGLREHPMGIGGYDLGGWIEPNGTNRPLPGDMYAIGKNTSSGIVHVGVIIDASTDMWVTADMGQNGGWGGRRRVKRPFRQEGYLLEGEQETGGGLRQLAGWLDVDIYPAFSKFPPTKILSQAQMNNDFWDAVEWRERQKKTEPVRSTGAYSY